MKISLKDLFNIYILEKKVKWLRKEILYILENSKRGHVGGALSSVEILVSIYYSGTPFFDIKCDTFILSKGHVSMALYPILYDLGFISKEIYKNCYLDGNPLGGHPDNTIPGIIVDSGSLGHGLSLSIGISLANKLDKKSGFNIVLLGDGECYEGSIWEAAMFASHHKLNNTIVFIDSNKQCATDHIDDCIELISLKDKWESFGWDCFEVDGNNIHSILSCWEDWLKIDGDIRKPLSIICNTVKGKGVSFMEKKIKWHHGVPNDKEMEIAKKELE